MPVGCAWGWCWRAEHAQACACTMTAPHQHDIMVRSCEGRLCCPAKCGAEMFLFQCRRSNSWTHMVDESLNSVLTIVEPLSNEDVIDKIHQPASECMSMKGMLSPPILRFVLILCAGLGFNSEQGFNFLLVQSQDNVINVRKYTQQTVLIDGNTLNKMLHSRSVTS